MLDLELGPKTCEKKQIDVFFEEFSSSSDRKFDELIKKYHLNEEMLIPYARWSKDRYQRVCLNRTKDMELVLLCWNKDQETPIHNHDGKECWVHVVKGQFEDTLYSSELPKKLKTTQKISVGDSTYLTDEIGSHSLKNISGELALTLHLYARPINQCEVYHADSSEVEIRYMQYDYDFSDCSSPRNNMISALNDFVSLSKELLIDENENPISKRISVDNLSQTFDIGLSGSPLNEKEYYENLKKIVLSTPKTSSKLFFNQLFGGRKSKAILGDLLAVMLNNSMYTYKVAGVQVGIEKEILNQVINLIGYGSEAAGTFPTGGSMSNFMAILMARDRVDAEGKNKGVTSDLVAYTSVESHYSIEKNAAFIGIGRDNVRKVPVDAFGMMRTDLLATMILEDKEKGLTPFFINATAGTTVLGAFDPIKDIAKISKDHKLWFHIDGAYAGSVLFSAKYKHLIDGVKGSDSFSFNAHKMLGTPLTCSIIVVNDKKYLSSSFSNNADYLYQTDHDEYNLGKTSFQCGRRNDALKFWTLWKSVGTIGLEKIVDHQFYLADIAREYVANHPDYQLFSFENSISVCFNYKDISANRVCTQLYENNSLMVGFGTFEDIEFIRLVTINSSNTKDDILNFFTTLEDSMSEIISKLN